MGHGGGEAAARDGEDGHQQGRGLPGQARDGDQVMSTDTLQYSTARTGVSIY